MARPKKILVAYDGSKNSREALDWAIDLSKQSGAQVVAVKVFELGHSYSAYEVEIAEAVKIESLKPLDQKVLDEAAATGQKRGVKVTTALLEGHAAAQIIDYAKQNDVDLIIAGRKGHTALDELLMGSVTRSLVSVADVPVLVVKG